MRGAAARAVAAVLAAACVALAAPALHAAAALPVLHADRARTSVSGLSSGGFAAVQYAVAFSSTTVGVGVVAGGPYNCAGVNFAALVACTAGTPSGARSWASAQALAADGLIDPTSGIAKFRAYLFSGKSDSLVAPAVVAATRDFFLAAGVAPGNLAFVDTVPAGHAFIAASFGNACGANAAPYIDRCEVLGAAYDQPKEILQQIYGALKPPAAAPSAGVKPFDQSAFAAAGTSMDSVGYVFIPAACAADGRGCAVHVVFHGCGQGARSVGNGVVESVGYNRWADTNRVIVLYPQVVTSDFLPLNPLGCWDWWGYTGTNFMVRFGVQLTAVKAMVDRLTSR